MTYVYVYMYLGRGCLAFCVMSFKRIRSEIEFQFATRDAHTNLVIFKDLFQLLRRLKMHSNKYLNLKTHCLIMRVDETYYYMV